MNTTKTILFYALTIVLLFVGCKSKDYPPYNGDEIYSNNKLYLFSKNNDSLAFVNIDDFNDTIYAILSLRDEDRIANPCNEDKYLGECPYSFMSHLRLSIDYPSYIFKSDDAPDEIVYKTFDSFWTYSDRNHDGILEQSIGVMHSTLPWLNFSLNSSSFHDYGMQHPYFELDTVLNTINEYDILFSFVGKENNPNAYGINSAQINREIGFRLIEWSTNVYENGRFVFKENRKYKAVNF